MPIPKVIHYCWFGGKPKPKLAEKCIRSWRRHCPDYIIREWNEDNYDLHSCPLFVRQAYDLGQWPFVTDYVRLDLLYRLGGFYFDVDVELKKGLDVFLGEPCFMGIEKSTRFVEVNTGLGCGAEPGFPLIKEMMEAYENIAFVDEAGKMDITTCTKRDTKTLRKHGYADEDRMQTVAGATIYPSEFFSPMIMETGLMYKTNNTVSVHYYSLSWVTDEERLARKKRLQKYRRADFLYKLKVFPNNIALYILGPENYQKLKAILKNSK